MLTSKLYFLVSIRALYFQVNKNYFIFSVILSISSMLMTENIIIATIMFITLISVGIYLSKSNPDFFDIFLESKRFEIKHQIHCEKKRVRIWEA